MSRLENLFKAQSKRVLNVYCTAGYPDLNSTLQIMESLQENGVNIIELGMPYSDPLAMVRLYKRAALLHLKMACLLKNYLVN